MEQLRCPSCGEKLVSHAAKMWKYYHESNYDLLKKPPFACPFMDKALNANGTVVDWEEANSEYMRKLKEKNVSSAKEKKVQDETDLRRAIYLVLTSPAGFEVSFGDLGVCRLENGTYAVWEPIDGEPGFQSAQHIWKTPGEAIVDFMAAREVLKLGYDFEVEPKINT
jgi:hypothetical protein